MQATEKLIARNFKLSKRSCIRYGNNSTRNDWLSESIMQLCGKKSDRKRSRQYNFYRKMMEYKHITLYSHSNLTRLHLKKRIKLAWIRPKNKNQLTSWRLIAMRQPTWS